FTGSNYTDLWLMLGDNAYIGGADGLYHNAVFDTYPTLLRQTVLWPTIRKQETARSSHPSPNIPYFEIFTFPVNRAACAMPRGSRHAYAHRQVLLLRLRQRSFRVPRLDVFLSRPQWHHVHLAESRPRYRHQRPSHRFLASCPLQQKNS